MKKILKKFSNKKSIIFFINFIDFKKKKKILLDYLDPCILRFFNLIRYQVVT